MSVAFFYLFIIYFTKEVISQQCYKDLGCFPQTSPWFSISRPFPAPMSPEKIDLRLYFYSRKSPERFNVSAYPEIDMGGSDFDPKRPATVFITHGFASSGNESWLAEMKNAYLKDVNANIFLVDWGKGASSFNYLQVASNTRVVGAILGRFINHLVDIGQDPSNFHLIGHSLGAHISGYAAKSLNNRTKSNDTSQSNNSSQLKVGRITGLDPAQPGFQGFPESIRLAKGDAKFMDIIHSDAKPFIPFFGFGYMPPLGDVDFYLNRGFSQPNCIEFPPLTNVSGLETLKKVTVEVISNAIGCSHGRSYLVFTSAIDPEVNCTFEGKKAITIYPVITSTNSCGSKKCPTIGLNTPNFNVTGSFQVHTSGKKPFCCNNYSPIYGCSNDPPKGKWGKFNPFGNN